MICSQQEKNDIATTFLERVTAQENDSVIAWTLFTILYEQRGEELNAEITLKKVLKLNQAQYSELQSSLLNTNPATNSQLEGGEEEKLKEEGNIIDNYKKIKKFDSKFHIRLVIRSGGRRDKSSRVVAEQESSEQQARTDKHGYERQRRVE